MTSSINFSTYSQHFFRLILPCPSANSRQLPLLLLNATLIDWNNTHLFGRHKVTTGGVLDEPQDEFISDHLPVHIKKESAMPLPHDCAVPTANSVPSPNPSWLKHARVCAPIRGLTEKYSNQAADTSYCRTAESAFDWCLNRIPAHRNNTVTWNCFCKAYNTM